MASSRKPVNLVALLVAFLNQHSVSGRHVALGLSGGMDSCVLLDLLVQAREQLDFQLSAVHVNHQISPHADAWQQFCCDLCLRHQVAFSAVKVEVPRDSGLGLEAAAREVRYEALLGFQADMIALAHHQDDQAETFLLQLLRGAGVKGLAAMSALPRQNIIRPLLNVPRSEIQQYARQQALEWIEDESNANLKYDRNFLRQSILPELAKRFPGYRETLARTAEHLANTAELLDQIAQEDAQRAVDGRQLHIQVLRALTNERAANLLRWWIRTETGVIVSTARLQNIQRQLCEAKANARVECEIGAAVLRRYRDVAYLDFGKTAGAYAIQWHGEPQLDLPDGSRLRFRQVVGANISADKVKDGLTVTNRLGADESWKMALRLQRNRPTRSLKNLWQEFGIPPWERDRQPMLWHDRSLVSISGVGIDCAWQAGRNESGFTVEWVA